MRTDSSTHYIILHLYVAIPFAHLRPIGIEKDRNMSKLRRLEPEGRVYVKVQWERRYPFLLYRQNGRASLDKKNRRHLPAENMGNSHAVVVHHVRKVVCRVPVAF